MKAKDGEPAQNRGLGRKWAFDLFDRRWTRIPPIVRQIPAREFSRGRRTILLLRGEKAGLREDVAQIFSFIVSIQIPTAVSTSGSKETRICEGSLLVPDKPSLIRQYLNCGVLYSAVLLARPALAQE